MNYKDFRWVLGVTAYLYKQLLVPLWHNENLVAGLVGIFYDDPQHAAFISPDSPVSVEEIL